MEANSSAAAKKVHAELRSLNLPTIEDIRDQFERKARELGSRHNKAYQIAMQGKTSGSRSTD
jgi:hypothetical protein